MVFCACGSLMEFGHILRERVLDTMTNLHQQWLAPHRKPPGDKQGCAYKPPYGMWATLLYREMYLRWTYDYCAYFSTGLRFLFSLSPWGERVLNSTWWKLSRLGVGNLFMKELLRQITSTTRSMRVDATGGFYSVFVNTNKFLTNKYKHGKCDILHVFNIKNVMFYTF